MKQIIIALTMLSIIFLAGCKEEKAPTVTPPAPQGPTTPVNPKPEEPSKNWDSEQAFCKEEGAKFNCGNPVWYGLKGCKPDSDGDGGAEGTYFAKSLEEIEALAKNGSAIKVKMKDGSELRYGVGFAAPCFEM